MGGTQRAGVEVNSGESVGFAFAITELGEAITPTSVSWTLLDGDRNVVNERQDVAVEPDDPTAIWLDPADVTAATEDELRYLTVTAVYQSSLRGGEITDELIDELDDESGYVIDETGEAVTMVRQWRFTVKKLVEGVP